MEEEFELKYLFLKLLRNTQCFTSLYCSLSTVVHLQMVEFVVILPQLTKFQL